MIARRTQIIDPVWIVEIDRARRHGLDEYVSADPCEFPHADLFKMLQHESLEYRMNDAFTCLVSMIYLSQSLGMLSRFCTNLTQITLFWSMSHNPFFSPTDWYALIIQLLDNNIHVTKSITNVYWGYVIHSCLVPNFKTRDFWLAVLANHLGMTPRQRNAHQGRCTRGFLFINQSDNFRAGSVQGRYTYWMSIWRGMVCVAVTSTCHICQIY